jgi:Flp pilus assembly protein TadB
MRTPEIIQDLKAVPDDVRTVVDDADRALERAEDEHPALKWALDIRVVLASAAIALVITLVARLAGLGFLLSLLLFFALFAGLWAGITRAATPRRPTRPA